MVEKSAVFSRRLELFQDKITTSPKLRDLPANLLLEEVTSRGRRREPLAYTTRTELVDAVSGALRPGFYVEVGCGFKPYVRHTSRRFTSQSPYVGIDTKIDRSLIQGFERPYVSFEEGKGEAMRFATGEVQEVFMGNVLLSAQLISPNREPTTALGMLQEAKRVLDPDTGVLVIAENDVWGDLTSSFGRLGFLLNETGFEVRGYFSTVEPLFTRIQEAFQWSGFEEQRKPIYDMATHFVIARPTTAPETSPSVARILFRGFSRNRSQQ